MKQQLKITAVALTMSVLGSAFGQNVDQASKFFKPQGVSEGNFSCSHAYGHAILAKLNGSPGRGGTSRLNLGYQVNHQDQSAAVKYELPKGVTAYGTPVTVSQRPAKAGIAKETVTLKFATDGDYEISATVKSGTHEKKATIFAKVRNGVVSYSDISSKAIEMTRKSETILDWDYRQLFGESPENQEIDPLDALLHQNTNSSLIDELMEGRPSFGPSLPAKPALVTLSGVLRTWNGKGGWVIVPDCDVTLWDKRGANFVNMGNIRTDVNGRYSWTYEFNNTGKTDLRIAAYAFGPASKVVATLTGAPYSMDV